MSDRPTPETDDIARGNHVVPTEWAEQLERQRDEARESLKHISEYGTDEINAAVELRQKLATALVERDEAREELHDIRLNLGEDADGYTLLHAVCVMQNERDEAMEDSLEQARLLGMGSEREAKLISERDEAVEEIKEWKTLCLWGGTPEHIHGFIRGQQSRIQHLECERDEAMELLASEKITRNHIIKRSVEVERERDEAREDLEHWKSEWEIVEARLCGWKHPRDNGIIFEHEVIPVLRKELDDARAVADELAAIATTPRGQDDDHLAQSRRISETLARWKSLASA